MDPFIRTEETTLRKLQSYVAKYGPEVGPKFFHLLQSQAAHAGVSARLRRKIEAINGRPAVPAAPAKPATDALPLFPGADAGREPAEAVAACPIAGPAVVG